MKLLEKIRKEVFWTIDALKGARQKKELEDVAYILENWGQPDVEEKHKHYLKDVLDYAVDTIPYYAEYKSYETLEDCNYSAIV